MDTSLLRVICVAGARPNFVKLKPVVDALECRGVDVLLVHTGQHYDESMSDILFEDVQLRLPDHYLEVGPGTHAEQTAKVMMAFEPIVTAARPDVVVVVGDVNSTMAGALVAAKCRVPVAHVEAGLRSQDWSMPEEVNRVVTDRVSEYLFAPSADAVANLLAEGESAQQVHLVGNVMIDTLLMNLTRARQRPVREQLGLSAHGYGLVTLHRPENVDDPAMLTRLVDALGRVADLCPLVFPVHPRTRARLGGLKVPTGLRLTEPVGYLDSIALQADARLVLTDSGGIQEETTFLGVACLTLREGTERPITVTEGTNRVVGRDCEGIVAAAKETLRDGITPRRPALWDGRSGERIADVLASRKASR